jgi:hypothetical protein
MEDASEQYNNVLIELISEAIVCIPQNWTEGTLVIECNSEEIHYRLKNDNSEEKATISNPLRDWCEKLYFAFQENGEPWTEATIHFYQDAESWAFHSEYIYDTTLKQGA